MASNLKLLSKATVGGQELKNRIVMSPLTRARCTPTEDPLDLANTNPNDLMVEHYAQRASSGLIISEATAISEIGGGWLNAPHIRTPENVTRWRKVTDAVHEKNGLIYLQLWHLGRFSHSSFHPSTNDIVSASAIPISVGTTKDRNGNDVPYETPRAMTVEDIKNTVQDYVKATQLAKEAGFDGIEIHNANGYLLDQFVQSSTNQRTDEYGGSMENRFRLTREIIEALIADGAFPSNRIGIKFSPNGNFGDMGSEDNDKMFPYICRELRKYNMAYIHIMDGLSFGYHKKCPQITVYDLKKEFGGMVICNVGLTKEIGEGMLRSGAADLAAYGQLYISNPDLPERFANNWPLNPPADYMSWWSPIGAQGYNDFPFYEEKKDGEEEVEKG